jgi:hypothetical protein
MGIDAAAPLTENAVWKELEVHYRQIKDVHLRRLFAEDPGRAERSTVKDVGITFDYSKNRITQETVRAEGTPEGLAPQRVCDGNRPTNTIVLEKLTPEALGKLVALYEHSVLAQGTVWNIDSFDQWGVELGKVLAKRIVAELESAGETRLGHDGSTNALIRRYRELKERASKEER